MNAGEATDADTVVVSSGGEGRARTPYRTVALPTEHGGWSLTAEPAILGLLVAWSPAGLALGVAAMVAFVARTPLKIVLVDRWRRRWLPRTTLAAKIAAVELVVFAMLIVYAAANAQARWWVPLAAAAPLIVTELWYDMRSRGRRLVPELAGAIGIGSIAAAIALADGTSARVAWGLWLVIGARSLAAIPYVRTQIRRAKNSPAALWQSDIAQVLAVVVVIAGWAAEMVSIAVIVALALVAVVNVAAVRLEPRPAMVIGIQQMVIGIVVIAAAAFSI